MAMGQHVDTCVVHDDTSTSNPLQGEEMRIAGIVPFKYQSERLPLKNFQKISNKENAPTLWQATYELMKKDQRIREIFFALDDNPETIKAVRDYGITNNIFQELLDYPPGRTLGEKIAHLLLFLDFNERLKDYDYILVAQVDTWPKFTSDIDDMFQAALEMNVDYLVSGHDGKQHGAWRMIKIPLTQEVLGQTIGVCEMGMERMEVHTEEDLKAVQYFYDNCEGEFQ